MMDESRRQFERFLTEEHLYSHYELEWQDERNCYAIYGVHIAWKAWQASRQAVVLDVNWPDSNDDTWKEGDAGAYAQGHEDGRDKTIVAVVSAAIDAGIKIKGIMETGG